MDNAHHVGLPRLATDRDIPNLVALRVAHLHNELTDDDAWVRSVAARLREGFATGEIFCAVVDLPGDDIGAMGVGLVTNHLPHPTNPNGTVGHIHSMYTVPELRSQGHGRAVLDLLLDTFVTRGVSRVELHSSRLGYRLYESAGFHVPDRGLMLRRDSPRMA